MNKLERPEHKIKTLSSPHKVIEKKKMERKERKQLLQSALTTLNNKKTLNQTDKVLKVVLEELIG